MNLRKESNIFIPKYKGIYNAKYIKVNNKNITNKNS